jgi:hypothetical protein
MSPKEKHVPADAHRTSVCFTAMDRAAVRWISEARRYKKNKRITINDIVVDALWYFLEKTEGKTREQIQETLPPAPPNEAKLQNNNVTQMPKPKKKR